jgi:hypothetical protein
LYEVLMAVEELRALLEEEQTLRPVDVEEVIEGEDGEADSIVLSIEDD